ncbi:tryptophan synthase subunit alpha [Streptomyces sp. NPDC052012]|uniref:tryptophan synthase subunit alpha n=1 Tax=Streptomyces sp. NPDC052012 TaxID=3155051 RepID=UPI003450687D
MMNAPTAAPVDRLSATFARARKAGRAALIGHLPACYPTIEDSITALCTLSWHADVLTVGLPEDPALRHQHDQAPQTALAAAMEILHEVSASISIPIVLASSWEPIERAGARNTAAELVAAGAVGVVLPDLPPTGMAAARWLRAATSYRLATSFLAARGQLANAATVSTGWVYLPTAADPARTAGVVDLADLHERTRDVRHMTAAPICTGAGITTPELAAATAFGVDGVIIDSAFRQALQPAAGQKADISRLDRCATRYAAALRTVPGGRQLIPAPQY